MELKYTIAYGNIMDGFVFVGVFDSRDEAVDYAESSHDDWYVVEIYPTQDGDGEVRDNGEDPSIQ